MKCNETEKEYITELQELYKKYADKIAISHLCELNLAYAAVKVLPYLENDQEKDIFRNTCNRITNDYIESAWMMYTVIHASSEDKFKEIVKFVLS